MEADIRTHRVTAVARPDRAEQLLAPISGAKVPGKHWYCMGAPSKLTK